MPEGHQFETEDWCRHGEADECDICAREVAELHARADALTERVERMTAPSVPTCDTRPDLHTLVETAMQSTWDAFVKDTRQDGIRGECAATVTANLIHDLEAREAAALDQLRGLEQTAARLHERLVAHHGEWRRCPCDYTTSDPLHCKTALLLASPEVAALPPVDGE